MDRRRPMSHAYAHAGLDSTPAWVVRILGLITILAGITTHLLTTLPDIIPATLLIAGLTLIAALGFFSTHPE